MSWAAPADDGGAPITSYVVTATRVYVEPQPDLAPVAAPAELFAVPDVETSIRLPVYDPNGDPVTTTLISADEANIARQKRLLHKVVRAMLVS